MTRGVRGVGAMRAREWWLVLGGGFVLACLMFWPLPLHLSRDVAKDAGDPLLQAWQVAWGGHALVHQPLDFWQANIFHPLRDTLAFSDALVGYAPAGVFAAGPGGALAVYNVLFLFAYALAVAGPYALARELGLARAPAVLCGLAFAYAPWRWEQSAHLHIISSGGIALALALWIRGYRLGRPGAIVGGWAVCAWQLLIGVSLGLQLLYLTAVLGLFTAVRWLVGGRPPVARPVVRATAAGAVLLGVALAIVAPPYLRVRHDHPQAQRTIAQLRVFSPPLESFLIAPAENPVWGDATAPRRSRLVSANEKTLFLGVTIVGLALLGLLGSALSPRLRIGLLVACVLAALFSLGTTLYDGRLTYRLLFEHAPGWDGIRTPGRLHTLTTLALAVLAGAGLQALLDGARGMRRAPLRRAAAAAAVVAACGGVLAEGAAIGSSVPGSGLIAGAPHPAPPRPPAGLATVREPYVLVPPDEPQVYAYMWWSTRGFPRIVNGLSGFDPAPTRALLNVLGTFPDAASVAALRGAGVRSVVALQGTLSATPFAKMERPVPPAGLGVTRRITGDLIVYGL